MVGGRTSPWPSSGVSAGGRAVRRRAGWRFGVDEARSFLWDVASVNLCDRICGFVKPREQSFVRDVHQPKFIHNTAFVGARYCQFVVSIDWGIRVPFQDLSCLKTFVKCRHHECSCLRSDAFNRLLRFNDEDTVQVSGINPVCEIGLLGLNQLEEAPSCFPIPKPVS